MHSVQYLLPHSVPELSPTWGHQTELDQCNIQPCSKCFSVEIMFFHALYETPMAPGRWRLMQGLTSPDSYSHNGSLFYLLQGIASNWMKKGKQIEIKLYVSKQTVIKWAGWTFIYISTGFEPSPFWESKKVWLIFFCLVCSAFPCSQLWPRGEMLENCKQLWSAVSGQVKSRTSWKCHANSMFGAFPVQVCILRRSEQDGDKLKDLEVIAQTKIK